MEKQGKVCTKCGEWKPLEEYNKGKGYKDGRRSVCRKCQKEYQKQYRENNKQHIKERKKEYRENNKQRIKEYSKQHYQNNKEYYKEQHKQWNENNKEHLKEYKKQWRENNPEYSKQHYQNNKEYYKEHNKQWRENNPEYGKQWRENNKENNLQYISDIVEQTNSIFKELNLPVYGYIYMFENIKTRHKYVGQSIVPLKNRYKSNVIQGWIEHRKSFKNQKFIDELIEEDMELTEMLDVACCKYHLDKLETYYISYYDSCNNGYNIEAGNHNTDDGLEEFEQILKNNGLQFIDGKLVKIA